MLFKELGNFTIIDTETTGFGKYSKLIEFAGIKFRKGEAVDKFETFVNPNTNIPEKITQITGITDEMVSKAPSVREVTEKIYSFIGDDVLVAHNALFDIDVLNRRLEKGLRNRFIDTLTIFKSTLVLENYKLETIKNYFEIKVAQNHRALDDVLLTYECLKNVAIPYKIIINPPVIKKGNYCTSSLKQINQKSDILKGCKCVVTGTVPGISRLDLQQLIVDHGGEVSSSICMKTKYLIVGDNYGLSKVKKAEQKIDNGDDIEILDCTEFLDLINKI